jgi:hypothetical protein
MCVSLSRQGQLVCVWFLFTTNAKLCSSLKARLMPVLEERVDGSFEVLFVDDGQAGLDAAAGDAVALMDADLQDPPELLEEFIKQPPLSPRRGHPMDATRSGKIHARAQRFRRYPARINE